MLMLLNVTWCSVVANCGERYQLLGFGIFMRCTDANVDKFKISWHNGEIRGRLKTETRTLKGSKGK